MTLRAGRRLAFCLAAGLAAAFQLLGQLLGMVQVLLNGRLRLLRNLRQFTLLLLRDDFQRSQGLHVRANLRVYIALIELDARFLLQLVKHGLLLSFANLLLDLSQLCNRTSHFLRAVGFGLRLAASGLGRARRSGEPCRITRLALCVILSACAGRLILALSARCGLSGLAACQLLQLLHNLLMVLLQHLCKLFYLRVLRLLLGKPGEFNFGFVLSQQAACQEFLDFLGLTAGLPLHVPLAEPGPLRRPDAILL
ncbi:MAG TPA: hypothetical protein VJ828_16475 [Lacipirellulaceae bacterium]|nr:hypothetical protein [Lacipirellulaceae bacterium]